MGNLRDSSIFVLGALGAVTACSKDAAKPDAPIVLIDAPKVDAPKVIDAAIDAPPNYDFTCEGMALPTTAATSITIGGAATTINGTTPAAAAGVKVELFKNPSTTVVDMQTTAATTGAYKMATQDNAGAAPYDGYLKATLDGDRPTYVYPAAPLVADSLNTPILILSTSTFSLFVQFLGGTQTTGNGTIGTIVTDCAGTPVDGVTMVVKQGGVDKGNTHSLSALSSQAKGTYFTFDVPPGETTISATYGTHTWRVHTVKSYADSNTTTIATP